MIASFSKRFVFLKTRKTAGTSIEMLLSAWCDPDDVCSAISPADELTRASFGGQPQNFCSEPELEEAYRQAIQQGNMAAVAAAYEALQDKQTFWNHMPAEAVRARMPALWDGAFKFCVERHPYEKAVSLAYFVYPANANRFSFESILDRVVVAGGYRNWDLYTIGGAIAVDQVISFDELPSWLTSFASTLGKQMPAKLPRAKSNFRKDRRAARTILTAQQRAVIRRICEVEFTYHGFEE